MKFGWKNLTLLIVLLLIVGTPFLSTAYEKIMWDFTSDPVGSVPVGFTTANLDGRVYNAQITSHFPGGIAAAVTEFANTSRYVVMGSWFAPVGAANRWLITPAITLPDTEPVLRWQGRSMDPSYPEAYNVRLSTTRNQPSDFTVTVQSVAAESGSFTNHSAALDSYAGQTVYIAFQLVSNDKFLLMLDNIEIDSAVLRVDAGGDQTIDYGGGATLTAGVYNGTAPYTYVWSDGAQTIGTEQSVTVSPDATSTYTCTVTDSLGETASDSVIVNVDSFLITASAGEGGSISPDGVARLAPGGGQTYTIAPSGGYRIASVLVDGVEQGRITSYAFSDVQDNHTITASFTAKSSSKHEPVYVERSLTDSGGVALSGSGIHRSSNLNVKSLEPQSLPEALRQAVSEGQMLLGYDIRLTRGFRGTVDISFPVGAAYEGQTVTILHYVNGNVETYTAVVTGGTATVSVSSLSPFVVLSSGVYAPANVVTDPPKTGDAAGIMGYAAIAAAVSMAAALRKRRKPGK